MNGGVIGITAIGTIVVGVEIVEGGRIGPMGEMLLLNLILGGIWGIIGGGIEIGGVVGRGGIEVVIGGVGGGSGGWSGWIRIGKIVNHGKMIGIG